MILTPQSPRMNQSDQRLGRLWCCGFHAVFAPPFSRNSIFSAHPGPATGSCNGLKSKFLAIVDSER